MGDAEGPLRGDRFLRRALAAGVLVLLVAGPGCAANDDVIDPDRPDTTNSANPVAKGRVQLETGAFYRRTSAGGAPAERRLSWETTLRLGIADSVELRVDAEPVVHVDNSRDETDVGDFSLGLKYRFLTARQDAWWPALALNPFVKLPIAQEPIGSGETDAGLLLLASFDLPSDFTLDVNAGAVLVGQHRASGHVVQARASASLSRRLIGGLSGFVELAFASRDTREGRDGLGVQTGVIWRVTRDVALDTALSTSLAGAAPDFGVRAGVSVRFGR